MSMTINALDPSQKSVLEGLLKDDAPDLSLVYGPPGTGKSHLIVSLLFELAARKKKVLFVSQNREALDVIIRKYHDIDNEMRLSQSDVKFLDFCLYLSDSSQRKLQYIRGLKGRIQSGLMKIPFVPSKVDDEDNVPYQLSYRELDKNINELNIHDNEEVGLDELLAVDLEFIRNNNIIPAVVNDMANVDSREIFRLLEEYGPHSANFQLFNMPNNELRFLNSECQNLNIAEIRRVADAIINSYNNCEILSANTINSDSFNICDILNATLIGCRLNRYFDIKKIKEDEKDFSDIYAGLSKVISVNNKIHDVSEIDVAAMEGERALKAPESKIDTKRIKDVSDLKKRLSDIKNAKEIISGLIRDGAPESQSVLYTFYSILQMVEYVFDDEFKIYEDYHFEELEELHKECESWKKKGFFEKAFSDTPKIFNTINNQTIKYVAENSDYIKQSAAVLRGSKLSFGEFKKLYNLAKRAKCEECFGKIKKDPLKSINYVLNLRETLPHLLGADYMANYTLEELIELIEDEISESEKLYSVAEKNNLMSLHIKDLADIVNKNIDNNAYNSEIDSIYDEISSYLRLPNKNSFVKYAEEILDDKSVNLQLVKNSTRDINYDIDYSRLDENSIVNLNNAILESQESGLFSVAFYSMKRGETLGIWMDRVHRVFNYNNIDEFDRYTSHNSFISKLRSIFGQKNESYINKYLRMDLDFDSFAEHIVYDLKRNIFDSLPSDRRPMIPRDTYFREYINNLTRERKAYYLAKLRSIAIDHENPAQILSRPSNFAWTRNRMESIRANTELIVESYPVIIATPADVAKFLAPKKELFDYVIFDEASQLLPGQAIPSIYRAKKAVIVGDPHQMPPTSSATIGAINAGSYDNDDGFLDEDDTSILDIIKSMQLATTHHLKVHYRSRYNILFEPSRKAIYAEDNINPIIEAKSTDMPLYISDNLGEDDQEGFRVVVQRANKYIRENPDTTFCILFTRKDKSGETGFRKYLEEHGDESRALLEKYESEKLLISTITNCQGIMGDHTILYIPHYNSPASMWFFKGSAGAYRRLNVAITRQVETLDIVMGDDHRKWMVVCQGLVDNPNTDPNTKKSAELLNSLLTSAGQQIDEEYLERTLGPNAENIDSPLTQELYDKLCEYFGDRIGNEVKIWCEVGYKIVVPDQEAMSKNSYNVGYRIDIGIYSVRRKRFVLGIEMDGATYHSGFYKQFSDAQRQEILESKGWNLYRIWSTNWLHNTKKEFNDLVGVIEEQLKIVDEEPEQAISEHITTTPKDLPINIDNGSEPEPGREPAPLTHPDMEIYKPNNPYSQISYRKELIDYLKESIKLGTPIAIKYSNAEIGLDNLKQLPFQKLYLKTITDDYIEARFDTSSSVYRIYIDAIYAYKTH